MALAELEKPRVTEIQVRMDCNGCVHKIKKALHGINGIYDFYIDFPQQKLTVIGWADPEKIIKAIRKTRKIATICSHTELAGEPPQQPPPEGAAATAPAGESAANPSPPPPPAEGPPPEAAAPPQDPPQPPPPPAEEEKPSPSPIAAETNANQPSPEVHVIYHHQPPEYRYGPYGYGPSQPVYVTHSYNTYRPSPYVTEYECIGGPPRRTLHGRTGNYGEDYRESGRNGNIAAIFSDENPNACTIV